MMLDDKDDGGDKDNTNKGWGYVDDNKIDNKDLVSQTITTTPTSNTNTLLTFVITLCYLSAGLLQTRQSPHLAACFMFTI